MAQVKLYGRRDVWAERRREVSDLVHSCLVEAWGLPEDKRFHRFLLLDADDLICPQRGDGYLIIEVLCFTGRSDEAKRALIRALYDRLPYPAEDVEITIVEMPKVNWGIRGVPADELALTYKVDV
ncbi:MULTISPECIES: tautomerase family protein [Nonomuraea]|uniref:Tautomerase family protein n=2 Tax=Nonomuraea TaxID=83681 RepID=A0A7Y6M3C6_9ACTN|nr:MULTISPECIES: tautomerase family protein [Nonomuraea]MCP2347921.1 phenylpyruvate tautomerase PptA (4-oxalocrotonate tautomerase family) [Nonomuraea roseoviolacea subsp. carminata]NUW32315.1 tautomerase family protein [Nonomuraea montanisoli]